MSNVTPIFPRPDKSALDMALDSVPMPAMPAGLAARIKREVPLLPQVAPTEPVATATPIEAAPTEPLTESATVVALPPPGARRRWMAYSAGGIGALAAAVAALALIGPVPRAVNTVVPANAPASTIAVASPALSPVSAPQADADDQPGGSEEETSGTRLAATTPSAPAQPQTAPAPVPNAAHAGGGAPTIRPQAAELAASTPLGPTDDARDATNTSIAPTLGPRGQMGPSLPQGYGYSGAIGGGPAVPEGAPVRMSGTRGPGAGNGPGPGPGPGGPPPP